MIFLLSVVSISNTASNRDFQTGSILFAHLKDKGGNEENTTIVKKIEDEIQNNNDVPLAKIATTDQNIVFDFLKQTTESENNSDLNNEYMPGLISFAGGSSLLSYGVYYDESVADDLKYGIVKYTVRLGDTPSSIATSFGISTYTILWANNIKVGDYIKPGQELEILPVSGVKHTVKAGDTVEIIAKKYKADAEEIIIYNSLPLDGIFPDGTDGKVLIIPSGENEAPVYAPKPVPRTTSGTIVSSSKYTTSKFHNPLNSHRFAYGHCTYYVASRVYVPWSGHAKSWLANSRAYGYRTGGTPVVGSIVVTTENRWYGHVAYVEAVSGNTITISEMNYVGWNRKSVRVLSTNSSVIRGYIYMN
ncbi:MAG: LysM peptidoglycan-binding domain-containing protein [Patescibacteria group bacterium]|nr:LysM peptidoglycan-binding domain-containing protein [Patescibacteria group bacterium]